MFRPARRRIAWFPIALIVLAALAVVAFLRAASFLDDPARDPVKADAAFVLGGDGGERVLRASELHRDGLAPVFVLTGRSLTPDRTTAPFGLQPK